MTNLEKAKWYIESVAAGEIVAGKRIRQAVARQLRDIERSKTDPSWPYEFDEEQAGHYLRIFDHLSHTKGKWSGQPFNLMPFHAFIVYVVYGWFFRGSTRRRAKVVYKKTGRKNAKTEFLAAIGTIHFAFDGEKDPEVYWFATKKDQSKIGWDRQKVMIEELRARSKAIKNYCDTSTYRIYTKTGTGFVAYLGQDSKTEDGQSASCGIGDEYHAHPTDDMLNVVESSMGTRVRPLTWLITTAGFNAQSPCARFESICCNILDEVIEDDSIFAFIFDLDEDDDPHDETTWEKANPAIPYIDTLLPWLQGEYKNAVTKGGSKWINFLTKNLNRWASGSEKWMKIEDYRRGATAFDVADLKGRICFGGLDLASNRDTNALALLFPPTHKEENFKIIWYVWMPQKEAAEREENDSLPYTQWEADGLIGLTPGNSVDYETIFSDITGIALQPDPADPRSFKKTRISDDAPMSKYNIHSIAYDRKFSQWIIPKLADEGILMEPFGQGFLSMATPTAELERMLLEHELQHGGNPMAEWQFTQVVIEYDAAGNMKITKDPRKNHGVRPKVDMWVAAVMAIGQYLDWKAGEADDNYSIYNEKDIFIFGED